MCIFNFMYNTHTFVIEIFSCLPLFKKNIHPPSCVAGGFFKGISWTKEKTCQLHSKIPGTNFRKSALLKNFSPEQICVWDIHLGSVEV